MVGLTSPHYVPPGQLGVVVHTTPDSANAWTNNNLGSTPFVYNERKWYLRVIIPHATLVPVLCLVESSEITWCSSQSNYWKGNDFYLVFFEDKFCLIPSRYVLNPYHNSNHV